MKIWKDGSQIIIEEAPTDPTRTININSAWACMDQTATEVIIINGRTDQGWRDLIANIQDEAGAPLSLSALRAIVGS